MKKMLMAAVVALTLLFGAFGSNTFAQDEDAFFDINADLALGWGSHFAEEDEMFSQNAQFVVVHVDVLDVDLFNTTSGVGLEVPLGGDFEYAVWSLNRAPVPGTNNRMYAGSDFKLIQSTENGGAEGDFDMRLVTGYRLADVGPGQLLAELYLIEENRPVSFALKYGF